MSVAPFARRFAQPEIGNLLSVRLLLGPAPIAAEHRADAVDCVRRAGALVYESRMNDPRCQVSVDKLGKLARHLDFNVRTASAAYTARYLWREMRRSRRTHVGRGICRQGIAGKPSDGTRLGSSSK